LYFRGKKVNVPTMDTSITYFALGKFFAFNFALPFSDQVTDLLGFVDLLSKGHVLWAIAALTWVFFPFVVELAIFLTKWITAVCNNDETFSPLKEFKKCFRLFPFVAPVRMLMRWYQLWWHRQGEYRDEYGRRYEVDTWVQKRKEKIEKIFQDAGSHGVKEAFLESFGQMVTQLVIITSSGHISYTQMASLPVSILALSFGASKAFFTIRSGEDKNPDPNIMMLLIVLGRTLSMMGMTLFLLVVLPTWEE